MKFNKKGDMGESMFMIYRVILVCVIAVVVFGVGNIVYGYEIDVRDAEARILAHEMVECLAGDGVLDLGKIDLKNEIVSYCDLDFTDRIYVGVDVVWQGSDGKERRENFYEGDSGALWIRELFDITGNSIFEGSTDKIQRYNPGFFKEEYSVFVLDSGVFYEGKIELEVLVNAE